MPPILAANGYLLLRILLGVTVLSALAIADLRRNGRRATRWREYAFLLLCVAVACLYGASNDQVSVTLSWEYFYYGKELSEVLGPNLPPDPFSLRLHASLVGVEATWSAGLLIGVALLIANNPRKSNLPRLTYPQLAAQLPLAIALIIPLAATGALIGHQGGLTWAGSDFASMVQLNMWRPYRFMSAWGEHLGAYAGGLLSLILLPIRIHRHRHQLASKLPPSPTDPPPHPRSAQSVKSEPNPSPTAQKTQPPPPALPENKAPTSDQ